MTIPGTDAPLTLAQGIERVRMACAAVTFTFEFRSRTWSGPTHENCLETLADLDQASGWLDGGRFWFRPWHGDVDRLQAAITRALEVLAPEALGGIERFGAKTVEREALQALITTSCDLLDMCAAERGIK